ADVFVEEFRGLEEIVFVILFDDAEFLRVVERTEMNGGGIDSGGDVHKFEAERATGQRKITNVADEGDIGIVNGDVQVSLIAEAGGLIGGDARGIFFLGGINFAAAGRRIQQGRGSKQGNHGGQPNPSKLFGISGDFHYFLLD